MSNAIYDAKGRNIYDGHIPKGRVDNFSALRHGMRRINLAEAVVTADPASHLTAAITDGGEGIGYSFPLGNTWASAELTDDAPYFTCPLLDVDNRLVGGSMILSTTLVVFMRSTPAVTDVVRVGAIIHNERDWRTATVDGRGIGLIYAVTNPQCQSVGIVNGTTSTTTGAATAGIVGGIGPVIRAGTDTAIVEQFTTVSCFGLDSSFDGVQSSVATKAANNGTGPGANGNWYITVFAARTSVAGVSNYTAVFDVWYTPIIVLGRLT